MNHYTDCIRILSHSFTLIVLIVSCSSDPDEGAVNSPPPPEPPPFDIEAITDTYPTLTAFENHPKWGPYNTHDPSIIKDGDYFYCYSTDAAYGITVRPGVQIRRSKDLVDWQFIGFAFDALPASGVAFIQSNSGTPFNSLWAPYVLKVGSEFRLYYSLSSPTPRLSVVGLATATNPCGPWSDKGLVVTSRDDNAIQTNAIDLSVIVTPAGEHWMYYGSAWDGIYVLKLNPATGLVQTAGDQGVRIAQRGFTGSTINGNIEGAEIIHNPELNMYFLFLAYDWLETKYNVRVGRSQSPEGPFLDFNGNDLNQEEDNIPMILAPYKFANHGGWQGTSHPSIFQNEGQYFIGHQGRPGVDKFYMVLHIRKVFWTEDGWPVVSPERYAGVDQTGISIKELEGTWEKIQLGYNVVPGFADQQVLPDFQQSVPLILDAGGSINHDANNQWTYSPPWLELHWSNATVDRVIVERGRDWENKKPCLVFTGLNNLGTAIWGKK